MIQALTKSPYSTHRPYNLNNYYTYAFHLKCSPCIPVSYSFNDHLVNYLIRGRRSISCHSYNRIKETFTNQRSFAIKRVGSRIIGDKNIGINHGVLVNNENNELLVCLCIKTDRFDKYKHLLSKDHSYHISFDPDIDDFILYINTQFAFSEDKIYKKLYKWFNKNIFIPDAFDKGMEVRYVPSINDALALQLKFPEFNTIAAREEFCSKLTELWNIPEDHNLRLNYIWPGTEIEEQDIIGKENLSIESLNPLILQNTVEEMRKLLKLAPHVNLVEDLIT